MKFIIVAVRDSVADIFNQPQFVQSTGVALRAFQSEVNRPAENNMFYTHPNDFELFAIGEFNDADASFNLYDKPQSIALARNLVIKDKE